MEMAMASVFNAQEFLPSVRGRHCTQASDSPASEPGVLRRVVRAMLEWRQAQADREIARFLARSGGRLTDDMERRLTEHLLGRNSTGGGDR
jgi:hypothetical protein